MENIEEPWMRDDNPGPLSDIRLYSLPFDPLSILRESRESITLEEMDNVNGTNSRKFIQTCPEDVLRLVSAYCMEDPRLWDIYWEVIYDAAVDIERKTIELNEKEQEID